MKIQSAIAIYFIMWWLILFTILPLGVRNAAEEGVDVEEGNDAGAPLSHGLKWKAVLTTIVTSVVFAIFYFALVSGYLAEIGRLVF
jgi:predicted secreted protein